MRFTVPPHIYNKTKDWTINFSYSLTVLKLILNLTRTV